MEPGLTEAIKGLSPAVQTIVLLTWFGWQMLAAKKLNSTANVATADQVKLAEHIDKARDGIGEHLDGARDAIAEHIDKARDAIVIELRGLREDVSHGLQTQARQGAFLERLTAIEDKIDRHGTSQGSRPAAL